MGQTGVGITARIRRPWLVRSLQITFALVVLVVLFTQIDGREVVEALRLIDVRYVFLIFCLYFIIRYVLAYQMSFGLAPLHMEFSTFDLFRFIVIASFYSLILPGDLAAGSATWYKLSRSGTKAIEAGGLVVYFRLVNTVTLVAVGLLSMWFDATLDAPLLKGIVAATFVGFLVVSVPLLSRRMLELIARIGRRWSRRLPVPAWVASKARAVWGTVLAFQTLSTSRTLLVIVALAVVTQVLQTLNYYFFALSLGLHLSLFALTWIRTIVTVLQMIPVSFAGLGVREVSLVALLQLYDVGRAEALSLSLVMFGMKVLTGLVGGGFEAWDLFGSRQAAGEPRVARGELEVSERR